MLECGTICHASGIAGICHFPFQWQCSPSYKTESAFLDVVRCSSRHFLLFVGRCWQEQNGQRLHSQWGDRIACLYYFEGGNCAFMIMFHKHIHIFMPQACNGISDKISGVLSNCFRRVGTLTMRESCIRKVYAHEYVFCLSWIAGYRFSRQKYWKYGKR